MTIKFYIGTHQPHWLRLTTIPLMVSHRRLSKIKDLPSAICSWLLDSGGFSELQMYGEWKTSAPDYAMAARRYQGEIGSLQGAAIQDWMCEPFMLKKTGLTVQEHQARTVNSYRQLRALAPDVPWFPVLQGYTPDDYKRHVDQYVAAKVNLHELPRVGVGSICRRQHSEEIAGLLSNLSRQGLRLHGFGVKLKGLALSKHYLTSADSMSWSFTARREPPLVGHESNHKNCANCRIYAELWYRRKVWPLIHNGGSNVSAKQQITPAATERLDKVVNVVQGRSGVCSGSRSAPYSTSQVSGIVSSRTNTARGSSQLEREEWMNNRNVLRAYQLLQSMTPDELAMLNLLRGLSESEREQLIEVMGPQAKVGKKKAGKKSQRASSLQQQIQSTSKAKVNSEGKCTKLVNDEPCEAGPSDPIHDETFGYAGYHEFAPGKSIAQSAGD